MIQSLRASFFIRKNTLTTYQRYFINKFGYYYISEDADTNATMIKIEELDSNLTKSGYDDDPECNDYIEATI